MLKFRAATGGLAILAVLYSSTVNAGLLDFQFGVDKPTRDLWAKLPQELVDAVDQILPKLESIEDHTFGDVLASESIIEKRVMCDMSASAALAPNDVARSLVLGLTNKGYIPMHHTEFYQSNEARRHSLITAYSAPQLAEQVYEDSVQSEYLLECYDQHPGMAQEVINDARQDSKVGSDAIVTAFQNAAAQDSHDTSTLNDVNTAYIRDLEQKGYVWEYLYNLHCNYASECYDKALASARKMVDTADPRDVSAEGKSIVYSMKTDYPGPPDGGSFWSKIPGKNIVGPTFDLNRFEDHIQALIAVQYNIAIKNMARTQRAMALAKNDLGALGALDAVPDGNFASLEYALNNNGTSWADVVNQFQGPKSLAAITGREIASIDPKAISDISGAPDVMDTVKEVTDARNAHQARLDHDISIWPSYRPKHK